ncbi:hypothetical protein ACF08M_34710 [Streptomyces sp. NPDC015032]|uniref:hypothetical protein n=1 Tax=Streptomyces sp. NPDC015032 TaxID=3364937 RepID=UPI0036F4E31D
MRSPPLPARLRPPYPAARPQGRRGAAPTDLPRRPTIALRQIDLPLQIDLLHKLGADFTALHTTVTALDGRPGSELLKQIGPQILSVHELVGRTLVRLSVLDGSQYTAVPGSRSSLETLSEVVASAAVAASQLARAVAGNPLEAAPFTETPDDAATRQARLANSAPILAKSLTTAVHHLALCAACCHHTASGIARDLKDHPDHRPQLPELSDAQYAALDKIAQGGANHYTSRNDKTSVRDGDGNIIHAKPFNVLLKDRLIRIHDSISSVVPREIEITARGRLVLDIQKPGRAQPASPGSVPAPAKGGNRRR